jgi:hypothetical protein
MSNDLTGKVAPIARGTRGAARYSRGAGCSGRDEVKDYARCKGMTVREVERWPGSIRNQEAA